VIAHDDFVRAMSQAGFPISDIRAYCRMSIRDQAWYRKDGDRMAKRYGGRWQRLHELATAIEVAELLEN
jgi:hypothetical protein